jgi:phosphoheptose isomerase
MASKVTVFPLEKIASIEDYLESYAEFLRQGLASVDRDALRNVSRELAEVYRLRRTVWVCGNGGSAAISDHFSCDHLKGVSTSTALRPRVLSLSSNAALLTAIGNDLSFERIFEYQLANVAQSGDVLVAVSSSGNSPNIVRAVQTAKSLGLRTIGFVGFDGGELAKIADYALHVKVANYGVVEDVHQSLMHVLAQFIRLNALDDGVAPSALKF